MGAHPVRPPVLPCVANNSHPTRALQSSIEVNPHPPSLARPNAGVSTYELGPIFMYTGRTPGSQCRSQTRPPVHRSHGGVDRRLVTGTGPSQTNSFWPSSTQ